MSNNFRQEKILFPPLLAAGSALLALLALCGCGQKGPLFLPRESAAANRATLPQALRSTLPGGDTGSGSSSNTSSSGPVPALPAAPASVVSPTPEPDLPPPYSPLTPEGSVPAFPR